MAKKVNIVTVDDIDGTEGASEHSITLDGKTYVIDLAQKNADALQEALAPFIAKARPVRKAKRGRKTTGSQPANLSDKRSQHAEARKWAQSTGMEVSERGRVSNQVMTAFLAQAG